MAETVTKKLYGGSVEIDFYVNSHRYKIVGTKEWLPSVTSVTGMLGKDALLPWAVGCAISHIRRQLGELKSVSVDFLDGILIEAQTAHEKVKDEAASIGSQVHDFAMRYALASSLGEAMPQLPSDADQRVVNGCSAFLDWIDAHTVKFMAVEDMVYSKSLGYVGIYDCLAEVDGVKTLIDYKTSKRIYPEHKIQISSYVAAKNEELASDGHDYRIKHGAVAHFDKETGGFEFVKLTDEEIIDSISAFNNLLGAKKALKNIK